MKKLVSLLTVFALVLLSACAWWSEPDPDNMRDETLWALSSPETLQTSNDAVTYYNRLYEAKDVMKTALHDLYRTKKDVSIHGLPVRWQVRLVKLLPHKLVMDIWMRQQKHNKLPDED